jgi:hypothetical protein
LNQLRDTNLTMKSDGVGCFIDFPPFG